jgi:acetyltransferase-like isoleucine patch superfamily enzyme
MINSLIKKVIIMFSYVFSYKTFKGIDLFFNQLYFIWLKREFKFVGIGVGISRPMYLRGGKYITIGNGFSCDERLQLDAIDAFLDDKFIPEIVIGDNVSIQKDCHIGAINKIHIGNNVLLASKVYISDHSHGEVNLEALKLSPEKRKLFSKGPVIIKDNVWIGEGVVVLPGVTIGENSIIGANAVVTRSIPKNTLAAGNPAKVIREIN